VTAVRTFEAGGSSHRRYRTCLPRQGSDRCLHDPPMTSRARPSSMGLGDRNPSSTARIDRRNRHMALSAAGRARQRGIASEPDGPPSAVRLIESLRPTKPDAACGFSDGGSSRRQHRTWRLRRGSLRGS
jgi:hypothetical protein